jgi:serine protease Do
MIRSRCDRLARGATVVALLSLAPGLAPAQQPTSTPDAAKTAAAVAQLQSLSDAFATVAERVRPSVVYITARQARTLAQRSQRSAPSIQGLPPELRRFFEMPGMPDGGAPPRSGRAAGSGFVVSADGYVLTNAHVVDSSTQVTVRLLDRREFPARIVGTDPTTDVAVLKIEATGLTPGALGDSDKARVGEWVLAIGNPLGESLTFTVTQGIISAKGRSLALPNRSQSSIQDFIQTDAAINPGNSGGPLINVRGEVIGINGAIASPTGYSAGYGFAVPINLARAVMSQIRTNGRVERAGLGVLVRDATTDDAAYVGLSDNRGVLLQDFASFDSPARRAGLQPGDVIISVDKRRWTTWRSCRRRSRSGSRGRRSRSKWRARVASARPSASRFSARRRSRRRSHRRRRDRRRAASRPNRPCRDSGSPWRRSTRRPRAGWRCRRRCVG